MNDNLAGALIINYGDVENGGFSVENMLVSNVHFTFSKTKVKVWDSLLKREVHRPLYIDIQIMLEPGKKFTKEDLLKSIGNGFRNRYTDDELSLVSKEELDAFPSIGGDDEVMEKVKAVEVVENNNADIDENPSANVIREDAMKSLWESQYPSDNLTFKYDEDTKTMKISGVMDSKADRWNAGEWLEQYYGEGSTLGLSDIDLTDLKGLNGPAYDTTKETSADNY